MNFQIAENTDIQLTQRLIGEANALGMRVVYHPEPKPSNVIDFSAVLEKRRMQMCQSAEA